MSEKKYTAQEAAIMVLAKAQELYKASSLAKAVVEQPLKKDEGMDPSMAMSESEPKEKPMKGPYKLAKWCGRMEHKRGMKKADTTDAPAPQGSRPNGGPEQGQPAQHAAPQPTQAPTQPSGPAPTAPKVTAPAPAPAAPEHKAVLDQIHQMTKPKTV